MIVGGNVRVTVAALPRCCGGARGGGFGELGGYGVQQGCFLARGQFVGDPEAQLGDVPRRDVRRQPPEALLRPCLQEAREKGDSRRDGAQISGGSRLVTVKLCVA